MHLSSMGLRVGVNASPTWIISRVSPTILYSGEWRPAALLPGIPVVLETASLLSEVGNGMWHTRSVKRGRRPRVTPARKRSAAGARYWAQTLCLRRRPGPRPPSLAPPSQGKPRCAKALAFGHHGLLQPDQLSPDRAAGALPNDVQSHPACVTLCRRRLCPRWHRSPTTLSSLRLFPWILQCIVYAFLHMLLFNSVDW